MSRLRRFTTTLTVLALLATVLALITAPAAAQDDDEPRRPTEVFIFANVMTDPDDDNDGEPDRRWQAQVTVTTLGNCVPKSGAPGYNSPWFNSGAEVGTTLSLTECVFRIAARLRFDTRPDCLYHAQLGWTGDDGNVVGNYRDGSVLTSARPNDESRLSIRRNPDRGCVRPHRTYFVLGSEGVVEDLPGASADADLLARARRAVAVGEYTVKVEPTTSALGCDILGSFTLKGVESSSPQVLGATGERCTSRASIVAAPAHVLVAQGSYVEFDAALPNIIIDLTSLISVEAARIAIIQDVVGSLNRGEVTYAIDRSCGGVPLDSPPAQAASSTLYEGRFTVHSPGAPNFGATGIYPAVATSATANSVVGCAVTVTVGNVPAGCVVAGGNSQTLGWSASNPITHFDFEFDFGCGGEAAPADPVTVQPPSTAEDLVPTGDAEDMVPAEDAGPPVDDGDDTGDLETAEPAPDPVGPPRDAPTG